MASYQIQVVIEPYKSDEFVDSTTSILRSIRKEKGCLDFRLYRDSESENTYIIYGEWQTRQGMEKHFKTQEYELLLGAARVLGQTFNIKKCSSHE
jgi:quinol monooxygenase YgiN